MASELFVNGPIQNGNFNIDSAPGKVAGVRLASILNELAGHDSPAPHIWNLARHSGDVEYAGSSKHAEQSRIDYELQKITSRYNHSSHLDTPNGDRPFETDVSEDCVTLTEKIVEDGMRSGTMSIERMTVPVCIDCGHDTGAAQSCSGCGSEKIGKETRSILLARRDDSVPVLVPDDTYGNIKTKYLSDIAHHTPNPLMVSKKRHLGIPLDSIGAHHEVLDPRAGLHIAALAVALAHQSSPDSVVMLMTAGDAQKSVAYGQHFRSAEGTTLRYGLHGRIPYDTLPSQADGAIGAVELQFQNWYLPLIALTSREQLKPEQAVALRKNFSRIVALQTDDQCRASEVQEQVRAGTLRWIHDKRLVGAVRPHLHN